MHMSNLLRAVFVCGALGYWTGASGQQAATYESPGIEVVTSSERLKSAEGTELVPVEQLRVGDEIFYTMRVRNRGDKVIANPSIVKAMPRNTRYIEDSAVGPAADITYSIDGGSTFATAEDLTVTTAAGTRRAEPADFTHIRWQLRHPLVPGATALLRFRGVFQ